MTAYRLDVDKLHALLDAERREQRMSWRAVGRECGLSASTAFRITRGHKPDADGLVTLLAWAGLEIAAVTTEAAEPIRCDRCKGIPPAGFACLACGEENDGEAALDGGSVVRLGRRNRVTDEHLADVAAAYRDADAQGLPPTRTVANQFGTSHSTAARWVGHARRNGLLGPTQAGKSGEQL